MSFVYQKAKEQRSDKDLLLNDQLIDKRPKERLNILLLGSGGRESAMAWRIAQSDVLEKLFIAPGNAGTELYGINAPEIDINNFEQIATFVVDHYIDMIVVGPEEPLVRGIVDYFAKEMPRLPVVGPSAAAAHIEGSKEFSKGFMKKYKIPTARYRAFAPHEIEEAQQFLDTMIAPYVIKADGLAAGKGVVIAESREEASEALRRFFEGSDEANKRHVVIEEFLTGIECSVFIATDGESYCILPTIKDYKRIGDGDQGPNTGGMGAVSPVLFDTKEFAEKVVKRIIEPTLEGLRKEKIVYKGFLFFGLISVGGEPHVIEYNCRLGDPETQALMLRIASDFGQLLVDIAGGTLRDYTISFDPRAVATVVLASRGYPNSYIKGYQILLPITSDDTVIFHAGTRLVDGKLETNGGRVLTVSAYGSNLESALKRSYTIAQQILFEGKNYRHDIGQDILKLEKE